MNIVECPRTWDSAAALDFNHSLQAVRHDSSVGIDLRPIDWTLPFGTLLVAESLRDFVAQRKGEGLKTIAIGVDRVAEAHDNALSYLKHVGFFRFIGLPFGKDAGEASGSSSYTAITSLERDELASLAPNQQIQFAIQIYSNQLASVISGDDYVQIMMAYCFQETIRNVFEHSESDRCVVMAQRYSRLGYAEIAIIDEGVGVLNTLRDSHPVSCADDAIDLALLPGVSRALDLSSDDKWANSGFGLFVLSQLGMKAGRFEICSSGRLKTFADGKAISRDFEYSGTGVAVRISLSEADYFPNALQSIIAQGEEDAYKRTGVKHRASKGSTGLWE